MSQELTEIQGKILGFLIEQKEKGNIPPTLAEIAAYFGYKNRATVQQHLDALEKKGFIKRNPKLSRAIEILRGNNASPAENPFTGNGASAGDNFFQSHPVIGEVAAGNPLTIYPDTIDTIELPSAARMPRDSFLLRVKGTSLKDAYIFNGDIVIVNPNAEVLNGHIVVAVLDDAAVVKRFYKKEGRVELHSENPEYQPIIVTPGSHKLKVVGVVVGVYRTMDRKVV